jgi:hypothetical protein
MSQQYLGDGVYADFDGYAVRLYTSDGIEKTNTIYLEPEVYLAFVKFIKRLGE